MKKNIYINLKIIQNHWAGDFLPKNSTGFYAPKVTPVLFSTSACGVWPRLRELATGAPLQSTAVERAALRCLRASRGTLFGAPNMDGDVVIDRDFFFTSGKGTNVT